MRRAPGLLVLSLALGACSPAVVEPPKVVVAAPVAAPSPPADARWRRVVSPMVGMAFDLPGEPNEWTMTPPEETWVSRDLSFGEPEGDAPAFHVARMDMAIHDRATDAVAIRGFVKNLKSVIKEEPYTLAGFPGVRVTQSTHGKERETRMVLVGRSLFSAEVQASAEQLAGDDVARFFGSLQLQIPWRVQAVPDIRCTVAVPTPAMELARPKKAMADDVILHMYLLGGAGEVLLGVAANPIDRGALARFTDDELYGLVIKAATSAERALLKQEPFTFDGRRGREATYRISTDKGALIRVRMLFVEGRLYQLIVQGRTEDQLDDAVARRFLQSFRADPSE